MGQLIYLKDVVTLELDQEKCVGCGMCLTVCPHAVLEMNNGNAVIQDKDLCMECGACARNCPTEAITVQAGVGCAAALINAAVGGNASSCGCTIESAEGQSVKATGSSSRGGCC